MHNQHNSGDYCKPTQITSSFFLSSSLICGTVGNICKACFGLRHRKASKKGRKEESKQSRKGMFTLHGGHEY